MRKLSIANWRRISQWLFLLFFFFLFIQTESQGNNELGYPVRLFLDFDPLISLTSLLASHALPSAFLLSLLVVAVTIVLGRVFCGWVCPLGTLHNIAGSLREKYPTFAPPALYRFKYCLLIFLVVSSLFTLQLVGVMDPIALIIRSFSISIYPYFNYGIRAIFDSLYSANPLGVADLSEPVYDVLKNSVLSFSQPFYRQGMFIGFIFLVIIGLNLKERRFWCKYLCPLGALLGIIAHYSLLKRELAEGCTSCGACAAVCEGNASPGERDRWRGSECLICRNCDDICPKKAVSFRVAATPINRISKLRKSFFARKAQKIIPDLLKGGSTSLDLDRRRVISAALAGALSVPLFRITLLTKKNSPNPLLIRPPGSLEERAFLERCVKCGECIKVCITNGLQPTLLEAGLEGVWSPVLVPRQGYCEYRCMLCGQVCPTGAIRQLTLKEKAETKIGLAMIDKGRCLPWSHGRPCIVCEEVCPTPKKAIWLEDVRITNREDRQVGLKQPHVDLELCIGCGICETRCPVLGTPAITVTSLGESRSKENQLLLMAGNGTNSNF